MNIQSISKEKREIVANLSADDLVLICNVLHSQLEEEKHNEKFLRLYSDMMMARDMCQYGHIDNFCLHNIVKCRNGIGEGLDGMLSDDDIGIFNSYLENSNMKMAFGNSDWVKIYKNIVGSHGEEKCGGKIQEWMKR